MKKYIRLLMFFLIPLVILGCVIIYFKNFLNGSITEYTRNNAPGNLINGGLFQETENKIYFSNNKDNNSLYVMNLDCSEFKKLNDESVAYINTTNKHIFFSKMYRYDDFDGTPAIFETAGIYHIKINSSTIETFDANTRGAFHISGSTLYYDHFDKIDGIQLYQSELNGNKMKLIADEAISPIALENNCIYYSSILDDSILKKIDFKTMYSTTFLEGQYINPAIIHNYIYYISAKDNNALGRCKLDGSNQTILVNEPISTYNLSISGKYLYYQVIDGKNNRLCVMNLSTRESKDIMIGDFNYLNVTSNYLFFQEMNTGTEYILTIGENGTLSTFKPPKQK